MTTLRVPPTVRGDTVVLELTVTDEDGELVGDLDTRTMRIVLREAPSSTVALFDSDTTPGSLVLVDAGTATVRLALPAATTRAFPRRVVWDLSTVKDDGTVETFFAGSTMTWVEGVSNA